MLQTMSRQREISIDEAVTRRHVLQPESEQAAVSSAGSGAFSQSASTRRTTVSADSDMGLTRQPVAEGGDARRRPVQLNGDSLALKPDSGLPDQAEHVKAERQQRLRDLLEMPPMDASKLYLKLASTKASALRGSQSILNHVVQLMYLRDDNGTSMAAARANATSALTAMVQSTARNATEKKIWELLRLVWFHCEMLRELGQGGPNVSTAQHAATISTMTELMTISFDSDAKDSLRSLGTQLCMTSLLRLDHVCYPQQRPRPGSENPAEGHSAFSLRNSVRVNACTILCNLLVNTPTAKAELAQTQGFLAIIKKQLASPLEELVRVSAVLLQNLSFHVDNKIKSALSDANIIPAIVAAASVAQMKPTVVALTSALWNMSAHSSDTYESNNKTALCSSTGGLELIVNLLDINCDDKNTQKILENTVGILQNISSHVVRNLPLLVHVRRLNIYEALSRCLRRRVVASMLRSVVGALSNFAAGQAEDKEAIRLAGIIPLLEDIVSNSSSFTDPKISVYAKQALTNINLAPVPTQRRQSAPTGNTHSRSGSFAEHRASPLTGEAVETTFRPSPTSSTGDVNHDHSVMNADLVHRPVPGRIHPRRQNRLESVQQFFTPSPASNSREDLQAPANVRSAVSADNVRDRAAAAASMLHSEAQDLPRKPPRKRASDSTVPSGQAPSNPSPFFNYQAPQGLASAAASAQPKRTEQRPAENWHARSQSDSATTGAHIPSNRLRNHGHRQHAQEGEENPHRPLHTRQSSTGSAASGGHRQLLSPSPTAPTSSQEIMLSQPMIPAAVQEEPVSPNQSMLGPVDESAVSITHL
ncbi:adenomatous polyposis coli protein-like [Sycon ciliatum]|uniref:adenomatous polyposis coli protein-like n=1 Tax=Sycon ciliatum TaxID=27933 RepID=UPI0031F60191